MSLDAKIQTILKILTLVDKVIDCVIGFLSGKLQ